MGLLVERLDGVVLGVGAAGESKACQGNRIGASLARSRKDRVGSSARDGQENGVEAIGGALVEEGLILSSGSTMDGTPSRSLGWLDPDNRIELVGHVAVH